MIDTSAATQPVDDIWVSKDPKLSAARGYAWSAQAKPLAGAYMRLRIGLFAYLAAMIFGLIVIAAMSYVFLSVQNPAESLEPSPPVMMAANILGVGGQILPFALIGVTAVCVILYSMFVYRAMKNLHLSNARALSVGPGWAVGWSFVPLANLAMIPSVMRQIWTASHDPVRGNAPPPFLTVIWWATWLGSGFIGRISEVLSPKESDLQFLQPEEYFNAFLPGTIVSTISSLLAIISTLCLLTIIRQINDAQETLRSTSAFDE